MSSKIIENGQFTRGGQFLVKETKCEDIFTLEDLFWRAIKNELRWSTQEFVLIAALGNWERFEEKKTINLQKNACVKPVNFGFLSVAVPESLWRKMEMGFSLPCCLFELYFRKATGSFSTGFGAHTGYRNFTYYPLVRFPWETKTKIMCQKFASGEWFGCVCLTEPGAGSDANSENYSGFLSAVEKH